MQYTSEDLERIRQYRAVVLELRVEFPFLSAVPAHKLHRSPQSIIATHTDVANGRKSR